MNVRIISTGEVRSVDPSYGARLIEQGRAVIAPKEAKKRAKKAEVTEDVTENEDT